MITYLVSTPLGSKQMAQHPRGKYRSKDELNRYIIGVPDIACHERVERELKLDRTKPNYLKSNDQL